MTPSFQGDEREWALERREFVADARDTDADADQRDVAADSRDAMADTRALEHRDTDSKPTLLARAFAAITDQFYAAQTYEALLTQIAEAAVAAVAGSDTASLTLSEDGGYRSVGATTGRASGVDEAQYEAGEGPALDAFSAGVVEAPSFPDDRWPALGKHPSDHGVGSSVAYRLGPEPDSGSTPVIGTLNVYSRHHGGFDATAVEVGAILASHASLAARAFIERTDLEATSHQLQEALLARDLIGQAKGILMERLRCTPDEAFDILRRSSQRLNVRLREVALRLIETGDVDPGDLTE